MDYAAAPRRSDAHLDPAGQSQGALNASSCVVNAASLFVLVVALAGRGSVVVDCTRVAFSQAQPSPPQVLQVSRTVGRFMTECAMALERQIHETPEVGETVGGRACSHRILVCRRASTEHHFLNMHLCCVKAKERRRNSYFARRMGARAHCPINDRCPSLVRTRRPRTLVTACQQKRTF